MSFLIHSISNSNVVPMEYYPCVTKAVVGTPMVLYSGVLMEYAKGTLLVGVVKTPLYISMGTKATLETGNSSGGLDINTVKRIPVIRVRDDIVFEAKSTQGALAAGDKVYIKATSNGNDGALNDYSVEKVSGSEVPQFEVVEAKEPNKGSTVQKVLIRYIG